MTTTAPADLRLSEYFTLAEAMASTTAERLGIDNTPPRALVVNLIRTAEHILDPVRVHFGLPFSPTSWFRTLMLNRAVNGSRTSDHPKGFAVDFKIPSIPTIDVAQAVYELCDFDQLIVENIKPDNPFSGWVHASYRSAAENRREILHKVFQQSGYRKGLGNGIS